MVSLADWCKENSKENIVREWDFEKNGDKNPNSIQYGCGIKVWWKCDKGHSFETTPNARTCKNAGCPYCSGKKVLKGFNDLLTTDPELAIEWDYEKNNIIFPDEISKGSNKKVWWKCPKGHSYQAIIGNRTKGEGCPYCSNRKVLSGFNDFETWCKNKNQLKLLEEWDRDNNNCLPSEISIYYPRKIKWICSLCGKGFESAVSTRTRAESDEYLQKYGKRIIVGCPSCTSKIAHEKVVNSLIKKKGSLEKNNPQLASEWDKEKNGDLKPSDVLEGTNKKVWWKCQLGHSYEASINNRTRGVGCPYCSGKKILAGFNDIATTKPILLEEWNYDKNTISPSMISSGSEKKVWWKCRICGNEWKAPVYTRPNNGCPRCSKELRTSFPEQAVFFYLSKIYPDTVNGDRHLRKELDIYIPSKKIAIEYDGYRWHSDVQKDIEKNQLCLNEGIILFRIREEGCPIIPTCENVHLFSVREGNREDLSKVIKEICTVISIESKLDVDVARDEDIIFEQYIAGVKKNSFAVKHPELLKFWDYNKNTVIKPEYVTDRTRRSVWWICEKGHSYKQSINSKTIGIGCPVCSNKKVLQGYNDLETIRPDIAEEWHPNKNGQLRPTQVTAYAKQSIWWLGKCGHEWKSNIYSRTYGSGCPYCSIPPKKVLKGFNDLQTKFPNLASEWDNEKNDLSPEEVLTGSSKIVWWHCPNGHSYRLSIIKRVKGQGCVICSNRVIEKGINDLATTNPELVREWMIEKNSIQPFEVGAGSNERVWWRCNQGHEWKASINSRVHGVGCPYCKNKKIKVGYNDLLSTHPDIAKKWNYEKNGDLLPQDVTYGSTKKVWWKCKENHIWYASVYSLTKQKCDCPVCSNKKIVENYNSIIVTNPELLSEWDYDKNQLSPSQVSYGSTKKIWWKCSRGHSYSTTVNAKTSKDAGCPFCSGQILLKGFNDLATCYPEIAKEWDRDRNKMAPEDVQSHSHLKVWWRCNKGHKWEAAISNRIKSGCPFCSNKRVLPGYNDIGTTNPDWLKEWDYDKNNIKPSEVSAGMGKKIWWKCEKGHSYQAVLYSRKNGSGCPICGRENAGRKKEKPVILLEEKRVFSSVNDAAKYCGLTPSAIGLCCKGKHKTAGGYHWAFYNM